MTPTADLVPPLVALAEAGIPTDIQELLVQGDPMRGIAPGALAKAVESLRSELEAVKREAVGVLKRAERLAFGALNFCDRFTVNDLAADDDQAKCAVQDLARLYQYDARAFVEKHRRDG